MVSSVGLAGSHAPGATPLTPEDLEGLLFHHVTTQAQLNELEEINILEAREWLRTAHAKLDVLDFSFAMMLHRRMFGNVWAWAGTVRPRETNIGVAPERIASDLKQLLGNTQYRIQSQPDTLERIATEFHHKLVFIHPFRNGNGRHGRLLTDALLQANGVRPFTWGSASLTKPGPMRDSYIAALVAAGEGNYDPLVAFVRN